MTTPSLSVTLRLGRARRRATQLRLAGDVWRVNHGGSRALAVRQQRRLADLVAFARDRSPYYRCLYEGLPPAPKLAALPPVAKPDLMNRFDGWVTDPQVVRTQVDEFIADPTRVGDDFRGRYAVCTTSGSSGHRAVILQDRREMAARNALLGVRGKATVTGAERSAIKRAGGRQAAVYATGGHFTVETLIERQRRQSPLRSPALLCSHAPR